MDKIEQSIIISLFFLMLVIHCVVVELHYGRQARLGRREIGLRFGSAFGLIYFVGMFELLPGTIWNQEVLLQQLFRAIGNVIPMLLVTLLVAMILPRTVHKKQEIPFLHEERMPLILSITVTYFMIRFVCYQLGIIDYTMKQYHIAVTIWTMVQGVAFGVSTAILAPVFEQGEKKYFVTKLMVITIGLNWVLYCSIIGLLHGGMFLTMVIRSGIDVIALYWVVTCRYYAVTYPILRVVWFIFGRADSHQMKKHPRVEGIHINRNIPYCLDGKKEHCLDVLFSNQDNKTSPILINIHGGGWMYGYKELNEHFNKVMAKKGYRVYSINYRLVPSVSLEEQIQDVLAAYEYIEMRLRLEHRDHTPVYVVGDSAGGQLALLSVAVNSSSELLHMYGRRKVHLTFAALGLISPACYLGTGKGIIASNCRLPLTKEFCNRPISKYVNPDQFIGITRIPPCILITSEGDIVSKDATRKLAKLLEEHHIAYKLVDYTEKEGKKLPHNFILNGIERKESIDTIEAMHHFFRLYGSTPL